MTEDQSESGHILCQDEIHIHVTVHRNIFLSKQPTRRINYPNLLL